MTETNIKISLYQHLNNEKDEQCYSIYINLTHGAIVLIGRYPYQQPISTISYTQLYS